MRTALVLGGWGFVGHHLSRLLQAEGMHVRSFDVKLSPRDDVRDFEAVRRAIEESNPDYVFHLAAQAYVPEGNMDPHRAMDVNVKGTLNLLEAVRHTGSPARLLLAGTSEEYGYHGTNVLDEESPTRPTTPYGISKLAAGHLGLIYARTYGLPVVVTRAFNHTGPGHPPIYAVPSFAKRVAEVEAGIRDVVRHGNLAATRNYSDVRDVVRAYRAAIELPSDVYNVCSDATVSLEWVLDTLGGLASVPIKRELDEALWRPTNPEFPEPSSKKLRSLSGWEPRLPLEQTLADTLDWWRTQL